MRPETLRRIRTITLGIATLAGAGIATQGLVESLRNDHGAIETKIATEIPGYDPDTFQTAQEEIVVFRKTMDLKSSTIEVPESVRQAVNYIEDHQTIYDQGNQVVTQEGNKRTTVFLLKYVGGIAMFVGSLLGLHKLNKKKQLPAIQPTSGVPIPNQ